MQTTLLRHFDNQYQLGNLVGSKSTKKKTRKNTKSIVETEMYQTKGKSVGNNR